MIFASTEIEKHVIGAVLQDGSVAVDCCRVLKPSDMYLHKHEVIWGVITKMALRGLEIDIITLTENLRTLGLIDAIGGADYLMEVGLEVISSANAVKHCEILFNKARRRDFQAKVAHLASLADNETHSLEALIESTENVAADTRSLSDSNHGVSLVSPDEWIPQAISAYDEKIYRGESTGWDGLDQLIRIAPGQTNVWTGIPSHGKSSMLDALMVNLAAKSNWRIAYFSPENNPLRRHIQKFAENSTGKLLFGHTRMSKEEYERSIMDFIVNHFFFFKQGFNGASFEQVLAEAARIKPRINALVVDPWNRLEARRPQGMSETEYILHCLRRAARFVEETQISLHIVAHPTKMTEDFKTGEIKKPNLYSISGSSHWFNAIDNGFMIFRNFETGKTEVHNLKCRFKDNGRVGQQDFVYQESGRYVQSGPPQFFSSQAKSKSNDDPW
jgi:hypothetical protein